MSQNSTDWPCSNLMTGVTRLTFFSQLKWAVASSI